MQELVAEGKQFFENKEYTKAEHAFKKVITSQPNYADVLNLLGVIHHIEGKFGSAIELFLKALHVNPHYTEALLNLAVLYNDLGRYKEAKKLYIALRKSPAVKHKHIEPVLKGKLSNLHADIGDIYHSLSLYDRSIDEYRKALELNPKYVDIKTKLGIAYRDNGQLKESLAELSEAIKFDARYLPARVQLGVTYYSSGKMTEAKKQWNLVLEKDPDSEHAKMYLRLTTAP